MAEYIEREALITKFKKMGLGEHGLVERLFADGVYTVIAAFPAANVAPVTHGKWEEIRDAYRQLEGWMCKKCGRETKAKENYCPNCGAKMDKGSEENNNG